VDPKQGKATGDGEQERGNRDGAAPVVVGEPAEDEQGEHCAGEVRDGDERELVVCQTVDASIVS
jgi:hypothetical protein